MVSGSFTIVSIVLSRRSVRKTARDTTITISGLVAKWPARAIRRLRNNGRARRSWNYARAESFNYPGDEQWVVFRERQYFRASYVRPAIRGIAASRRRQHVLPLTKFRARASLQLVSRVNTISSCKRMTLPRHRRRTVDSGIKHRACPGPSATAASHPRCYRTFSRVSLSVLRMRERGREKGCDCIV